MVDEKKDDDRSVLLKDLTLPFPTQGVGHAGRVFLRSSSMFFKSWKEVCWLHLYPTTLLIFRSQHDLDTWRTLHTEEEGGAGLNKDDKLVKFAINFDVNGIVQKKMRKLEKRARKLNKESKKKKRTTNEPYIIHDSKSTGIRVIKYEMEEVHSKIHKNRLLHTFKTNRWTETGISLAAMFGSHEPQDLKDIRKVIRHCMKISTKSKKTSSKTQMNQNPQAREMLDDSISVSSGVSSSVSGITYRTLNDSSMISGASTTIYDAGRVRHRKR